MKKQPPKIDWDALRNLRDVFLSGEPVSEPYWTSDRLLRDYDRTLGERIGWKWDAVLQELQLRGWTPPADTLTDLGCGTGIATCRLLAAFPGHFTKVTLWDHSPKAMIYAKGVIRRAFPDVQVDRAKQPPNPDGLVLISHVLTELDPETASGFMEQVEDAAGVLWVEPGTYPVSRMLIDVREALRDQFKVLAPCTHQAECGLLAGEKERHWCHHFAPAPAGAHQDSFWGHFRRELNLDIGPVAYSFLALGRTDPKQEAFSHLVGAPRFQPKFLQVLSCNKEGVDDLVASRRSGEVYRTLKRSPVPLVFEFERRKNRIVSGTWIGGESGEKTD